MFLEALCPPEHGHSRLQPWPAFLTPAQPWPRPQLWLRLPWIPLVIRNGNSRPGTFNNGAQRNACKAKLLDLHCLGIFLHIIKIRGFALPFSPCSLPCCFIGKWELRSPWVGSITRSTEPGAFPDPVLGFWRGWWSPKAASSVAGCFCSSPPPHPVGSVSCWFGTAGARSCLGERDVLLS